KEFQRFDPNPHFRFLLAGSRSAARPRVPAKAPRVAKTSRRVIIVLILSLWPAAEPRRAGPGGPARTGASALRLMQKPLHSVLLHLLELRVPQGGNRVTGRKEADTSLAVVVSPRRFTGVSGLSILTCRIRQPLFLHAHRQDVLRVFLVNQKVLLVGDHEVVDPLGDGVVVVDNLHLERPNWRMSEDGGALDVAIILPHQGQAAVVVPCPERAAFLNPPLDAFALLVGDGGDKRAIELPLERWVTHNLDARYVVVTAGVPRAIAKKDQDFVTLEVLVSDQLLLIGEVDGDSGVLYQRRRESRSVVIRV